MELCWQVDPQKRPRFVKINRMLDKYLEELAGYVSMDSEACLFPEIKQQAAAECEDGVKTKVTRKRSNTFLTVVNELKVEEQSITISLTTPRGAKHFF